MEQADEKKMITEMNDFLDDRAKAKKADREKKDEQLPFESIDSYSTDPIGFSEMALRMLNKVEFLSDLAAKENRFSSKYLKRCTQLEKGIKYLGSLCITKYALQRQGQAFPQLGQLSTEKLFSITSHHFRKLDMAVTEFMFEHQDMPDKLFDMEMRYFNLLERLRSTETRIYKLHNKYTFGETDYAPVVHGLAFSEKSWSKHIHQGYDEAPVFRHAPAFSAQVELGSKKSDGNEAGTTVIAAAGSELSQQGLSRKAEEREAGTAVTAAENRKSDGNEEGETSPIPSACHREQLSKAESHRKVAEVLQPSPSLPPFAEIMQRVEERSREADDGSLIFTFEEMEFLAKDPLFARFRPALAADIRKTLAQSPPG